MVIIWILYFVVIYGLSSLLNSKIFNKRPASTSTTWFLTIAMFVVSFVALSSARILKLVLVEGLSSASLSTIDMSSAFVSAVIFYGLINKKENNLGSEIVNTDPTAVARIISDTPTHMEPNSKELEVAEDGKSEEIEEFLIEAVTKTGADGGEWSDWQYPDSKQSEAEKLLRKRIRDARNRGADTLVESLEYRLKQVLNPRTLQSMPKLTTEVNRLEVEE